MNKVLDIKQAHNDLLTMRNMDNAFALAHGVFSPATEKKLKANAQRLRKAEADKAAERETAIRNAKVATRKAKSARARSEFLSIMAIFAMGISLVCWHLMGVI